MNEKRITESEKQLNTLNHLLLYKTRTTKIILANACTSIVFSFLLKTPQFNSNYCSWLFYSYFCYSLPFINTNLSFFLLFGFLCVCSFHGEIFTLLFVCVCVFFFFNSNIYQLLRVFSCFYHYRFIHHYRYALSYCLNIVWTFLIS